MIINKTEPVRKLWFSQFYWSSTQSNLPRASYNTGNSVTFSNLSLILYFQILQNFMKIIGILQLSYQFWQLLC